MKRIPGSIGITLLMTALVATGCGQNSGSEEGKAQAVAQAKQEARPVSRTMVIPEGTNIVASLETRLATDENHSGDAFRARTVEAVVVDGRTVFPSGSQVNGVLSDVQASGKVSGRARMTLTYQGIVDADGKTHSISAQPLTLQAASKTRGDVEKIAAGTVLGAIIGGIAGGGKDAAIGAGAGAAAGTIVMLATKGEDMELNPGQSLNVHMLSSTSIVLVAQK